MCLLSLSHLLDAETEAQVKSFPSVIQEELEPGLHPRLTLSLHSKTVNVCHVGKGVYHSSRATTGKTVQPFQER